MNIRDVMGVSTPAELYEIASHYGVHVSSMDKLIRLAIEIQRRALASRADAALEKMVANAESLNLYEQEESK